jgi:hypothetical protein
LAHPFKQVWRSIVVAMAAAALASPFLAAAWACDRLMVPFAAKAKLGGNATSRTHSTKRMTASPFFSVIRSNAQLSHGIPALRRFIYCSASSLPTRSPKVIAPQAVQTIRGPNSDID